MSSSKSLLSTAARSLVRWARSRVLHELWYPRLAAGVGGGQLAFLFDCLAETANVEGDVIEVGCAFGHTTMLLREYLRDRKSDKKYICIDTFAGFTSSDIRYEHESRKKTFDYTRSIYARNHVEWFKMALEERAIRDVEIMARDIAEIRPSELPPVSFCFLDVDLYKPVERGLKTIYERMSPGGIIVVDDCAPVGNRFADHKDRFDGALQAYREFIASIGQEPDIVKGKLGVVRKPR